MTPLENEINGVKKEIINMWILVQSQLNKAKEAMIQFDKDLAREVLVKEKRVNSFELKIDRDVENVFAVYCPAQAPAVGTHARAISSSAAEVDSPASTLPIISYVSTMLTSLPPIRPGSAEPP